MSLTIVINAPNILVMVLLNKCWLFMFKWDELNLSLQNDRITLNAKLKAAHTGEWESSRRGTLYS